MPGPDAVAVAGVACKEAGSIVAAKCYAYCWRAHSHAHVSAHYLGDVETVAEPRPVSVFPPPPRSPAPALCVCVCVCKTSSNDKWAAMDDSEST